MLPAVGLLIMENKKVVTVVKRLELLTVVLLKRRFLRKAPGLIELEQNRIEIYQIIWLSSLWKSAGNNPPFTDMWTN